MSSLGRGNAVDRTQISVSLVCSKSDTLENEKQKLKEAVTAIQAMLNSEGGKVNLSFTTPNVSSQMLINVSMTKIKESFVRKIEQHLGGTAGIQITSHNINFKKYTNKIIVEVERADDIIINNYNLFLPTETQVVLVSPQQPLQRINDTILRKVVRNGVKLGSHCKKFVMREDCHLREGKFVQVKSVKSASSKRTTLADRMTGKSNKFNHYVSAFANYKGGNIYYGVTDDGVVEAERIPNANSILDITKKAEKCINKMIWPQQIGQPKRKVHWDIFFEPVRDDNAEDIPSTYVIVIYIAPCPGGVFTEEPECYEMVEGNVKKMPFLTLKKKALKRDEADREEEIPGTVQRITWSSAGTELRCTNTDELLMEPINNARWDVIFKTCKILLKRHSPKMSRFS